MNRSTVRVNEIEIKFSSSDRVPRSPSLIGEPNTHTSYAWSLRMWHERTTEIHLVLVWCWGNTSQQTFSVGLMLGDKTWRQALRKLIWSFVLQRYRGRPFDILHCIHFQLLPQIFPRIFDALHQVFLFHLCLSMKRDIRGHVMVSFMIFLWWWTRRVACHNRLKWWANLWLTLHEVWFEFSGGHRKNP